MADERTEDLNPGSEDIEEKVRRMLDPSVPDEPEPTKATPASSSPAQTSKKEVSTGKPKKAIEIQAISAPTGEEAPGDTPSAPELPGKKAPKKPTKSKKVIIPISHDQEETAPEIESDTAEDEVTEVTEPEAKEAEPKPDVQKITITDQSETPEEVAEKLEEAIAELEPAVEVTKETPEIEEVPEPEVGAGEETEITESSELESEEDEPLEPAAEEAPITESEAVESPETDKAVEDIVAAEGDELLEVEDALKDSDEPVKTPKKSRRSLGKILKALWAKPAFRWAAVLIIIASVVAGAFVPHSRYFLLNTLGVRANSSVVILDESTGQPLKNAEVKLGSSSGVTDADGRVQLRKVKLGAAVLTISKRAFAPLSKPVTVGLGSNPLGDFSLTPTGSQYSFTVTDFLSGKPIGKVEASSGVASALSDDKGVIKLTIDTSDDQELEVTIKGENYRIEKLKLEATDKTEHPVKLVPAKKQLFVSKRTGTYDIYSIYIDGKEESAVLAGSGSEREDMVLVPHPTSDVVAYISTRGNQHNKDGFLLSNLILIHTDDNQTTNVTQSERIRIIGWLGDRLVYVAIKAGASANDPKRFRLMSYDHKDNAEKELASSNFFNDVIAAKGTIYYAPSSAYQTKPPGFYRINPDGTNQQTVSPQEVWNIFRISYDNFALSVQQQWYSYRLGDKSVTKLNTAPATQISRVYIDSPNGKNSAWVDNRDGKGVVLVYDLGASTDKTLRSQSGLSYPISWLSDSVIVYRVKTDQETADYAISIEGGEPVKIRDVTNSGGITPWFSY